MPLDFSTFSNILTVKYNGIELKYLKYYYACHSIRVSKDLYSQKYSTCQRIRNFY